MNKIGVKQGGGKKGGEAGRGSLAMTTFNITESSLKNQEAAPSRDRHKMTRGKSRHKKQERKDARKPNQHHFPSASPNFKWQMDKAR